MKQRIEHMKDKGSFLKDYQTNMMKAAGSKGIDTKDPKQIPSPLNILFLPAITVKFREGTAARLDGKTGKLFPNQFSTEDNQLLDRLKLNQKTAQEGMDFANDVFANLGVKSVQRLFGRSIGVLDKERRDAQKVLDQELADPTLYFVVDGAGKSFEELAEAVDQLNTHPAVEIAYLEPSPYLANADIAPATPAFSGQGYLEAAPLGIDARYAWTKPGGRGDNVRVIDVEYAWHLDHEDLPGLFFNGSGLAPAISNYAEHGTAVIGILAAEENPYGFTGIVPRVNLGVNSWFGILGIAHAIDDAAAQLRLGDVLVIEIHYPGPTTNIFDALNGSQAGFVPVEFFPASFDVIQRAVGRGVVVVAAAGNGSVNFDTSPHQERLNRALETGSILVGAGVPGTHGTVGFSNFGARVDVQGWGQGVATLGYGDVTVSGAETDVRQWYTAGFSGTSSATPIVAGAAAAVQSALVSAGRPPLAPIDLRNLLRDTGTQQDATETRRIGPLPNLRTALDRVLPPPPPVPRAAWPSLGGVIFGIPVVASNLDGRMSVFAIGGDGRLWTIQQTSPNGPFSPWTAMPAGMRPTVRLVGQVAAGNAADGRIEVFSLGDDNHLWHIYQTAPTGGFSGWDDMGGDFTSDPAVGVNDNGRLEVFIRGRDNTLMHNWQMWPNGGWYTFGWQSLGGNLLGAPSVVSNADRRLEVFVRGDGGELQHIAQNTPGGTWSAWMHRGGVLSADPVAVAVPFVSRPGAAIEVIGRGGDGRLYASRRDDSGWTGYAPVGDPTPDGAEVAMHSRLGTRLAVFTRLNDGSVEMFEQSVPSFGWSAPHNLGGSARSNPAVGVNANGNLEVFAIGYDGSLIHFPVTFA